MATRRLKCMMGRCSSQPSFLCKEEYVKAKHKASLECILIPLNFSNTYSGIAESAPVLPVAHTTQLITQTMDISPRKTHSSVIDCCCGNHGNLLPAHQILQSVKAPGTKKQIKLSFSPEAKAKPCYCNTQMGIIPKWK